MKSPSGTSACYHLLVAEHRLWIDGLDESRFAGRLDCTMTPGVAQSLPFDLTLAHVFHHATHHRGQITAAITAMGYPCPEIDMVWMLQEEGRASA